MIDVLYVNAVPGVLATHVNTAPFPVHVTSVLPVKSVTNCETASSDVFAVT